MKIDNEIFIAGAQKSGTSTLFDVLRKHDKILPSKVKEPQFFALEESLFNKHESWYGSLFDRRESEPFLLDGSTFYFTSKWAIENIAESVENPYFLFILRDPVRRAYSAYYHMNKKVPSCDIRSFDTVVHSVRRNMGSKRSIRLAEEEVLKNGDKEGVLNLNYIDKNYLKDLFGAPFVSKFEDPLWPFRYFHVSQFSNHIEKYEKVFGESRIKIITLNELINSSSETIRSIFNFLGLDSALDNLSGVQHKNKTLVPKGKVSRNLLWLRKESVILDTVWKSVRNKYQNFAHIIRSFLRRSKPKISNKMYKDARCILQDEYSYWSENCSRISSQWD
jgi:hypothetical protein